jgi:hypothetical protein
MQVNECIRRFPDVDVSGMAEFDKRLRTVVALRVGSLRRITPKSGDGWAARQNAGNLDFRRITMMI